MDFDFFKTNEPARLEKKEDNTPHWEKILVGTGIICGIILLLLIFIVLCIVLIPPTQGFYWW